MEVVHVELSDWSRYLADERGEVPMAEVPWQDLFGELLHVLDQERHVVGRPADDVLVVRVLL